MLAPARSRSAAEYGAFEGSSHGLHRVGLRVVGEERGFLMFLERIRSRSTKPLLNMNAFDPTVPLKDVIDRLLEPFLHLNFPWIAMFIDWEVPHVVVDQKLRDITPEAYKDSERFDKLVQIRQITGRDAYLLIHFEFSNPPHPDMQSRLDDRCHRILDRYRLKVMPVTVLVGVK